MCFINLLKKRAVPNLGFKRAARSVRGNTAYLTPPARCISSIFFCHVRLHRTPAAAEGPLTRGGLPPGGHRPAPASACDSSLAPSAHRSQWPRHLGGLRGEGWRQPAQPPWGNWRVCLSPAVLTEGLFSSFPFPFHFVISSLTLLLSLVPFRNHLWGLEKLKIFLLLSDGMMEIKVSSVCSTNPCVISTSVRIQCGGINLFDDTS